MPQPCQGIDCNNLGPDLCLTQRCSWCCTDMRCNRHRNRGRPKNAFQFLPSRPFLSFKESHMLRWNECFFRNRIMIEEEEDFNSIYLYKASIPKIKVVEQRFKNWLFEKHLIQVMKPIKAFQTRRRKTIEEEFTNQYKHIITEFFENERTEIVNEEDSDFLNIMDLKSKFIEIKELEKKVHNRKVIAKKDKFHYDIIMHIGGFVDLDGIVQFMRAFKVEDESSPIFVNAYKQFGFTKVGINFLSSFLQIRPCKQLNQTQVLCTYRLTKEDLVGEPYDEVINKFYPHSHPAKMYNERRIIALENRVAYDKFHVKYSVGF